MQTADLKRLYSDVLKDLYSAENQLLKALPKMAKAATEDDLQKGFEAHLEQTKVHVERLERIFEALDQSPTGKKCVAMQGLVAEGAEVIGGDFEGSVLDAALIGAARRVEHYEMAAYGAVCELAEVLGETNHASLLSETLAEEVATDTKLTELAKKVNSQAHDESRGQAQHAAKPGRKTPSRAA